MSKLVGGTVFVDPNGIHKVRVFRHGFIEPIGDISEEVGQLIQEMSMAAVEKLTEKLGKRPKPRQVFEFMGWKEDQS